MSVEQGQVRYTGVERRKARRVSVSHAALCTGFGAIEGIAATLAVLLPALLYHRLVLQVPIQQVRIELYLGYGALVGALYGILASVSAARFLGNPPHAPHAPLAEAALSWTGAFAVGLFGAFLLGVADDLSRVSLILGYVLGLPLLLMVRSIAYAGTAARIRAGRLQYQKVAVIGKRSDVDRFLHGGYLWKAGYQMCSALYLEDATADDGMLREGAVVEFAQLWVGRGAEYVVIVGEVGDVDALERITNELKRFAINVVAVPATGNTSLKYLDVVPIGPNNAVRFLRKPMNDASVLLKRVFDILGAGVGLLLLSPLLLLVALAIKLDSPGPVLYRQERRGFNGQPFFIWKFRSMTVTESGRQMTQVRPGDKRITRVGAFIRRTSIDELPQLFNVLHGEMSLVGPRPHAVMHDDELGNQLASYAHRQRIKPGITGWAQVNGYRGETTTLEQIEGRTAHDLYYIDNWSIFLDCWIILLTVFSAKTRRNAV